MSNYYTGETIEEATQKGLAELNLKKEDVEILVIEAPSKGFLGFGKKGARIQIIKKAKVEEFEFEPKEALKQEKQEQKESFKEIKKEVKQAEKQEKKEAKELEKKEEKLEETPLTPIDNPSSDALTTKAFLTGLFEKLNLNATAEVVLENEENVILNVLTEDSSFVIGYRGEVLDSIQTLAGAVYNTNKEKYLRVVVDCENYRTKREKTLISLAKKLAIKAKKTGRKITLEPMNPFERRVIHSALMDEEGVSTVSEGKEPNRFVAVIPDGYDASKDRRRFNGNRRGGKPQGRREYNNGNREKRDFSSKPTEQRKPRTSTFGSGVFLGNSLKDNNKDE